MKHLFYTLLVVFIFTSCQDHELQKQPKLLQKDKLTITIPEELINFRNTKNGRVQDVELKDFLNESIFAEKNFKVSEIHVCKSYDASTTVETLDQQFQSTLASRWVPGDSRRNWSGDGDLNNIDWVSFSPFAIANDAINAEPIYRSMYNKWQNDGHCKTVGITEVPYDFSLGNPSMVIDFGLPDNGPIADISVVGFLPGFIFEQVFGEENILGVAISFVFIDEDGNPVKTTRGKEDKAFTEVWFNDGFTWATSPGPGVIDLESIILHEFGHTLNLGHFGILQLFEFSNGTYRLDYRPVNTMNALYIGESRNFLGPNDKGNFCEAWGSWPWN